MRRRASALLCLLGGLGLSAAGVASVGTPDRTQYQGIVERNVFGLKPPAPQTNEPPPAPPPPKLTLTGITTILGDKRALFEVDVPGKPAEAHMLVEGQREAEVEVLEINENEGTVKVNNHGTVQTLDFKANGATTQTASLRGLVNPGPPAGGMGTDRLPPGMRTIPRRTLRLPQVSGGRPNPGWPAPKSGE